MDFEDLVVFFESQKNQDKIVLTLRKQFWSKNLHNIHVPSQGKKYGMLQSIGQVSMYSFAPDSEG